MASKIKVGGVWKDISSSKVKVGGVWKTVSKIYIKVGGVWKTVWTNAIPAIWTAGNNASDTDFNFALASINLMSNGTIDMVNGTDGSWLPAGKSAADYRAKWVKTGGTATPSNSSGWGQNVWGVLSTTRQISLGSGSTFIYANVQFTIEEIATGAQLVKAASIDAEKII